MKIRETVLSTLIVLFVFAFASEIKAQTQSIYTLKVNDGTVATAYDPNALIDMQSSSKGLLLPRLALQSTTSASPLTAFTAGMVVYNTDSVADVKKGYYYSDGTKWIRIAGYGASGTTNLLTAASGSLNSIVNGVTATLTPSTGSVSTVLGFDASGNLVKQLSTSMELTNALSSSVNTLTSTVNSVVASAPIVNSVASASKINKMSTAVNGVVGDSALIINSVALTSASNGLTSTVNGVSATLNPASGTVAKSLGFDSSGNLITQDPTNTPVSVSNAISSGSLTTTVNNVTGAAVAINNVLSSSGNTLTSTVADGTAKTASIVNSNTLVGASNKFTSTVNGIPADLTPSTANALSTVLGFDSSGNLTAQTASGIPTTNLLALVASTLTSTVNGVAASINLSALPIAGDVTGTLASSKVEKIQGTAVSSTAPSTGQVLYYDGTNWVPTTSGASIGARVICGGTINQSISDTNVKATSIINVTYEDPNGGPVISVSFKRTAGTGITVYFAALPPTTAYINYTVLNP